MLKEGLFEVTDDEQELFVVAEDEGLFPPKPLPMPTDGKPTPLPITPDKPVQQKIDDEDWKNTKDPKHFVKFLKSEIRRIGTPSAWHTEVEKERGRGQLAQLNRYISSAVRDDYDGILDIKEVDNIRRLVEKYMDVTDMALDGLAEMKKMRKRRSTKQDDLVKNATAPHFTGYQMNISAFERAIVGALINGTVSGGRNVEELYKNAKKKYDISDREELAIFQIMADMGYPVFKDRLKFNEGQDPGSDSLGEWASQYYA